MPICLVIFFKWAKLKKRGTKYKKKCPSTPQCTDIVEV